jgi:tetratricopeptide (TPR) repeat protein
MSTWKFTGVVGVVLTLGSLGGAAPPPPAKDKPAGEDKPYRPFDYLLSTDQAIQFYQERVKRDPQDVSSLTLMGQMQIRKARESGAFAGYDRAEVSIRRALKLDPEYLPALINQAVLLSARHRFADALRLAQELYKKHPGEPQILLVVGDAHLELGDYREAERAYEELQKQDREAFLATRQSRLAELKGDPKEALRLMEQAAEHERSARVSREGGVWYQVRLGDLHFGSGRPDEGARHYQDALHTLPKCAAALAGLGQVRAAQGKTDEAIDLYRRAVAVTPEPALLAALGDLLVKAGKQELAQVLFDKLESTDALDQDAYNRELSLFFANHDRNLPRALELARRDLKVRRDVYAHDTLAWALYKNGRFEEAAAEAAEALKLGSKDATLLFHAGMIQHRLGHKDKARDLLGRALAVNPYFSLRFADEARRTLAALGGR